MNVTEVLGKGGLINNHLPTYTERPNQIKLAEDIHQAIIDNKILLAEAPTGIGKSLANLVPIILETIGTDKKGVIATATKALQNQYYVKDLPFLNKIFDNKLKYCMVKGRGNYICLNKFFNLEEEIKTTYSWQVNGVKEWLSRTTIGDLEELPFTLNSVLHANINSSSDDCIGKKCPYKDNCYYLKMREKMQTSNLILVNIDLLCTDSVIRNKYETSIIPDYDYLVIDEAHELEGIYSKYISSNLTKQGVLMACRRVFKMLDKLKKHTATEDLLVKLAETMSELNDIMKDIDYDCDGLFDTYYNDDIETYRITGLTQSEVVRIKRLRKRLKDFIKKTMSLKTFVYSEELLNDIENSKKNIIDKIVFLNDMLTMDSDDNKVYWIEYTGKKNNANICYSYIDISDYLENWLFKAEFLKSCILLSATLTIGGQFDYIKERLGLNRLENLSETILPSDFDYKHNTLIYMPKDMIEPTNKENGAYSHLLAKTYLEVCEVTKGKILGLFTSYSEMQRIYELLKGKVPYDIYMQGDLPKSELLEKFKSNVNSILLATSSFWTGISVEGESCSAVIIDKMPFPIPSEPMTEATIDYMKENGQDWFGKYYLPQAIIAIQQGFGRLIRTNTDMGMVVLCDTRILTKPYGKKVLSSLPDCLETRNIEKVKFFFDICKKKQALINKKNELKKSKECEMVEVEIIPPTPKSRFIESFRESMTVSWFEDDDDLPF